MKTFRALCAVVLFGLLGCGGGGSNPPTAADFCAQYAKAVCGISSACAITTASCELYQTGQCMTMATAAVAGGKRVFAPGNMNNCLNKVKAAYNGNTIAPKTQADIDLACGYVFQGTGKLNSGTCTTQFECAGATDGSNVCDPQLGVCAAKKSVNGGDPCNGLGNVCPRTSAAFRTACGVLLCTADAAVGASCATTPCDSTSRCVAGKCAARAQAGEVCSTDAECSSAAPYCNLYVGGKCSAGLQFAAGLASCSCVGQGVGCPSGTPTTGTAGAGGGSTGAAGSAGGAGGHSTGAAGRRGRRGRRQHRRGRVRRRGRRWQHRRGRRSWDAGRRWRRRRAVGHPRRLGDLTRA